MKSKKITESNIDDSIFNTNSGEWWIEDGAFKALHSFNLIRTKFLKDAIKSYPIKTLKNKKILDVGCGRGHLLENLALKANLINQPVGVEPVKHDDFVPQNIKIFQGQKALPSQYENIPAFEKDFIGYNYEFLNQVIADHRKKIDK